MKYETMLDAVEGGVAKHRECCKVCGGEVCTHMLYLIRNEVYTHVADIIINNIQIPMEVEDLLGLVNKIR